MPLRGLQRRRRRLRHPLMMRCVTAGLLRVPGTAVRPLLSRCGAHIGAASGGRRRWEGAKKTSSGERDARRSLYQQRSALRHQHWAAYHALQHAVPVHDIGGLAMGALGCAGSQPSSN